MKIEKQILHHYFDQAKIMFKQGKTDEARDYLDMMLMHVALKRGNGSNIDEKIEDIPIGLWIDRAWQHLEKWNLML
jgi:hypothetical protein